MILNKELADILSAIEHTQRFKRHVENGDILGMMMPNGKKLSDCTGTEIGRYGEWLTNAGHRLDALKAGGLGEAA